MPNQENKYLEKAAFMGMVSKAISGARSKLPGLKDQTKKFIKDNPAMKVSHKSKRMMAKARKPLKTYIDNKSPGIKANLASAKSLATKAKTRIRKAPKSNVAKYGGGAAVAAAAMSSGSQPTQSK